MNFRDEFVEFLFSLLEEMGEVQQKLEEELCDCSGGDTYDVINHRRNCGYRIAITAIGQGFDEQIARWRHDEVTTGEASADPTP